MKMYAKLSRNLFDPSYEKNKLVYYNGKAVSSNNGLLSFVSTSDVNTTKYTAFSFLNLKAGQYTFRANLIDDNNVCSHFILFRQVEEGGSGLASGIRGEFVKRVTKSEFQEGFKFNAVSNGNYYLLLYFMGDTAKGIGCSANNIMLNEGDKALPYEPYMEKPIQPIKFLYKSRNLVDYENPIIRNNISTYEIDKNTNTIVFNSNFHANSACYYYTKVKVGKTYTISIKSFESKSTMLVLFVGNTINQDKDEYFNLPKGENVSRTFTATSEDLYLKFYINYEASTDENNDYYVKFEKIMLNEGDKALPYEPYMPLTKMKAFYKSRNLFDIRKITGLKNSYGSSFNNHFIVSGDELTVKYGAYGFSLYLVGNERYLKVGDYTMSCLAKNNEDFATATKLALRNEELGIIESPRRTVAAGEEIELTYTFSITQEGIYYFSLQPDGNASKYTNLNFVFSKIMFNKGSTALPYEPPQEYPN